MCNKCPICISESSEFTASPEVDPAIEAMYAVIPKEHREEKRKKNQICIQQYDDIDLLPLESQITMESDGLHLQAMEGDISNGYSRLRHVGPRMSQSKKHTRPQSGGEKLMLHDVGNRRSMSLSVANANSVCENSNSELCTTRPTSKLIVPNVVGKHALIEVGAAHDIDCDAPPLPKRLSTCLLSPVEIPQNMPGICDTASNEVKSSTSPTLFQDIPNLGTSEPRDGEHMYSVVNELTSKKDAGDDSLLALQAGEQLYDVVK